MDNASKAIIIAGATLLAVGLISLFMMFYNTIRNYNTNIDKNQVKQEVSEFNKFFLQYTYDVEPSIAGSQIYGYDVYNVLSRVYELDRSDDLPEIQYIFYGYNVNVTKPGTAGFQDIKTLLKNEFDYSQIWYELDHSTNPPTVIFKQEEIDKFKRLYTFTILSYDSEGRISKFQIQKAS